MLHALVAGERVADRGGGDAGARPQRVEGDAVVGELRRHASTHMLMPYFAMV